MKQYVETYRITVSSEMKKQLLDLKRLYNIKPTSFIRMAIREKIEKDTPKLVSKLRISEIPF